MAGTMKAMSRKSWFTLLVSMESGLDGRNNINLAWLVVILQAVSMESGLDGRNNEPTGRRHELPAPLSQWSPA